MVITVCLYPVCGSYQILQGEVNRALFSDLLAFIKNAHKDFGLDRVPGTRSRPSPKEIPTAAFVTGKEITSLTVKVIL